jgi:hypothetical protein
MQLARLRHEDGTFLLTPKPSPIFVFRLFWWMAWRHELFHYHVERFSTRQEIALSNRSIGRTSSAMYQRFEERRTG